MRHAKIKKRNINPDTLYNSVTIAKLINYIMIDGKKTVAQEQIYSALEILAKKGNGDAIQLFEKAIQNVGPKVEVKAKRIGGANYQVPVEVKPERRSSLALRWIIEAARKKNNREFHSFAEKLAQELLDATQNQGEAIRKRDVTIKQAEANRAFGNFRW
ncbi:MAG TPA: 30S ribosomal protein S7 [Patescibacteria group bacterium]